MAPPSSAHVSAAAVATGSLGSWRARSTSGSSVAVVACGRRSAAQRVTCSVVFFCVFFTLGMGLFYLTHKKLVLKILNKNSQGI